MTVNADIAAERLGAAVEATSVSFVKFGIALKLSQDLLDDYRPNPNFCDPFTGHACFIHTRASWGCLYDGPCHVVGSHSCPNPSCEEYDPSWL